MWSCLALHPIDVNSDYIHVVPTGYPEIVTIGCFPSKAFGFGFCLQIDNQMM